MTEMAHSGPLSELGLSPLSFGAAPLGNEYGVFDEAEIERTVRAAIDAGVVMFDTSPYYGRTLSESRLGQALGSRRDEIVLCTKAGRYDRDLPDGFDFTPERLRRSVDESLARLRTDRLDVLLLHDIEFSAPGPILGDAIGVLAEMKQAGKCRVVGVSSYRLDVLEEIIRAGGVDVVLTYCHSDLIDTSGVDLLAPIAADHGVAVIGASPLHMGLLTPSGGPDWHPALSATKRRAEILQAAAAELGVSLVDAALSFALSLPGVATTVVGISSPAELEQNLAVLDDPVPQGILDDLRGRVADVEIEPWPCGIWPA